MQAGHRKTLRPAEKLRLDSAKPWREPRSFFAVSCLLPPVPPALLWSEGWGWVDGVGEGQVNLGSQMPWPLTSHFLVGLMAFKSSLSLCGQPCPGLLAGGAHTPTLDTY